MIGWPKLPLVGAQAFSTDWAIAFGHLDIWMPLREGLPHQLISTFNSKIYTGFIVVRATGISSVL